MHDRSPPDCPDCGGPLFVDVYYGHPVCVTCRKGWLFVEERDPAL